MLRQFGIQGKLIKLVTVITSNTRAKTKVKNNVTRAIAHRGDGFSATPFNCILGQGRDKFKPTREHIFQIHCNTHTWMLMTL